MVVCAVRYEPVSLLFGQYQGLFRKKQRSGRCIDAGTRLAAEDLEGAAGSAKDNRARGLNRRPGETIRGRLCK
jgi:hypothetical protein